MIFIYGYKFALINIRDFKFKNAENTLPNLDSFSSQVGDKSESMSMNQELALFKTLFHRPD
jgi:hypothetical protein